MKKTFFIIIIIITGLISCKINDEIYDYYNGCTEENISYQTTHIKIESNNFTYPLETYLGSSQKEQTKGLMCRQNLPPNIDGMIFKYKDEQNRGFWMYKTYFPITIIYFDENKNYINHSNMNPCTRGFFESKKDFEFRCLKESYEYNPEGSYLYVLEIIDQYKYLKEIISSSKQEKLKLIIKN